MYLSAARNGIGESASTAGTAGSRSQRGGSSPWCCCRHGAATPHRAGPCTAAPPRVPQPGANAKCCHHFGWQPGLASRQQLFQYDGSRPGDRPLVDRDQAVAFCQGFELLRRGGRCGPFDAAPVRPEAPGAGTRERIENGDQTVVISRRKRLEFVVMTASSTHGQAHEHLASGAHHVVQPIVTALHRLAVVTLPCQLRVPRAEQILSSGDHRFGVRIRQFVAANCSRINRS